MNFPRGIRTLAKLLVVTGVVGGYSLQVLGQFEVRHSPWCEHDHGQHPHGHGHHHHHHGHGQDHEGEGDESPEPENQAPGGLNEDCSCQAPVVAAATVSSAWINDEPVVRIGEVPATFEIRMPCRFPSGIYHPPRA